MINYCVRKTSLSKVQFIIVSYPIYSLLFMVFSPNYYHYNMYGKKIIYFFQKVEKNNCMNIVFDKRKLS